MSNMQQVGVCLTQYEAHLERYRTLIDTSHKLRSVSVNTTIDKSVIHQLTLLKQQIQHKLDSYFQYQMSKKQVFATIKQATHDTEAEIEREFFIFLLSFLYFKNPN